MNDTIERVARAIYEENIRVCFKCEPGQSWNPKTGQRTYAWDELPDKEGERRKARAAISVMREPTDEMLDRTFDAEPFGDYENDATGYLRDVWQHMIDVALASK